MGMPSHPSRLPWHGVTRSGVRIPSLRKRLSLLLSNLWTEIDPSFVARLGAGPWLKRPQERNPEHTGNTTTTKASRVVGKLGSDGFDQLN